MHAISPDLGSNSHLSAARGRDHVAAGDPERARILVGVLADRQQPLAERDVLAPRLEHRPGRQRQRVVVGLLADVLGRRAGGERDPVLVGRDLEPVRASRRLERVALVPLKAGAGRRRSQRARDRLARTAAPPPRSPPRGSRRSAPRARTASSPAPAPRPPQPDRARRSRRTPTAAARSRRRRAAAPRHRRPRTSVSSPSAAARSRATSSSRGAGSTPVDDGPGPGREQRRVAGAAADVHDALAATGSGRIDEDLRGRLQLSRGALVVACAPVGRRGGSGGHDCSSVVSRAARREAGSII